VPGNIAERFLRHPEETFKGTGGQPVFGGQFAHLAGNPGTGAVCQRFALVAQCLRQPHPFQRGGGKLLQEGVHLRQCCLGALQHIIQCCPGARRIRLPACLRRGGAHLNAENLLLDRIVQLARQPVAFLLGGVLLCQGCLHPGGFSPRRSQPPHLPQQPRQRVPEIANLRNAGCLPHGKPVEGAACPLQGIGDGQQRQQAQQDADQQAPQGASKDQCADHHFQADDRQHQGKVEIEIELVVRLEWFHGISPANRIHPQPPPGITRKRDIGKTKPPDFSGGWWWAV